MRQPPSLIRRLTLLFAVAAAIVFSAFGWFIERSIEHHFSSEDAAELQVIANAVSQGLAFYDSDHGTDQQRTALKQRFNDILLGHHSAELYILAANGDTLFSSPGGAGLAASAQTPLAATDANNTAVVYRWNTDQHSYRVLTQQLNINASADTGVYTLSVAVTIDHHLHFLNSFRRSLWLMIISAIVIMGLIGWIVVHQGHAPLHHIVAQISRISANELNTRLSPQTVPQELTKLAVSFNDMLDRIEESFRRLSNFSADIAHELRTPVATLLTQTQVALSQSRNNDEYREILYSNIEEYERMAQMITDMLFLAKTDNGQYKLDSVTIDINQEVNDLFEYYEAWAEERGVTLTLDGHARLTGDRLMIRRTLANLISNAIRHTPSGNSIRVDLSIDVKQSVTISVENPGPTIPAEHLPRLFDRFYRVDSARQRNGDGAGLGLAIAKAIIDLHGGKIEVSSSDDHTQFRITIPTTASIEAAT